MGSYAVLFDCGLSLCGNFCMKNVWFSVPMCLSKEAVFETPRSTERGNAYIVVCLLMFSSVLFTKCKWEEAHLSTILSPVLSQEIELL